MNVYLDTSVVLAVLNPNDQFHSSAREQWQAVAGKHHAHGIFQLGTPGNSGTGAAPNGIRRGAHRDCRCPTKWVSPTEHWAAVQLWLNLNRRQISLVDCVRFVQMRRLGIQEVFTFDSHFAEQGFTCPP